MWSKRDECCVECGLSDSPHMAKGSCARCYQRRYRRENASRIAGSKRAWYASHPEFHKERREARHFAGARQAVIARDGNKCTGCDKTTGLIVHHLDGNGRGRDGPNNDMSNLVTLCRACHARHHHTNKAWSRHHECCVRCARTDRKHNAKGLCWSCYSQPTGRSLLHDMVRTSVRAEEARR